MATCIPFQSQLSSIMEVLLKAAVAEISKLVDDKCAVLHLEISRKQTENELLRRKLLLLESKTAQLQRGVENYMDRGGGGAGSSCPPTAAVKFPEIDDAAVSFTIKEESPDEALWIRDSSGPIGSAVQYHNAAGAPENRQFEVDQQATHSEATRRKISEFGASYTSGPHAVDIGGLQFTVKTEKEEERPAFRPDGCQHGGGKQPQLAVEFSLDERDTQLWSAIIEGNDIDAGFPDFSSVVDEYSDTFPDHSETSGRAASVQPPAGQRLCNGIYGSDVAQSSAFLARPPADKQKEQVYLRNTSQGAHLRPADPEREAGEKPGGPQSHNAFSPGSFPPPHRPLSGTARGFACSHCGKSFSRLHQFKLHQQSHKRKRAFWCAVCGKSFQCSSHLSIHHRTHTGEKPYGCAQCGKRFTQQSSLRVHQRTHSGERPYSCSQCGKTFILMHHLKRHRIIHTYS